MPELTLAAGGDNATEPDSEAANASGATSRVLPWGRGAVLAIAGLLFLAVGFATDRPRRSEPRRSSSSTCFRSGSSRRSSAFEAVSWAPWQRAWSPRDGRSLLDADLATGELLLRCGLLALLGPCFGLVGDRLAQAASDRALIAEQNLYIEGLTVHGLVRLDQSGSIARWNRGATEILGYSEAEAQSQPLALIFGGRQGPDPCPARCSRAQRAAVSGMRRGGSWGRAESAAGRRSA